MVEARSGNVRTNPPVDGLICAPLKPHSREKLLVLGYYLQQFTKSMCRKYPNLVYLDLYGGPGRGRFPSGETIDGSAIIAARTTPPFTKIIAAEEDRENATALEARLRVECAGREFKVFQANCNDIITDLVAGIPRPKRVDGRWTQGVLTFCFVDPFDLGIHLSTLRAFKNFYVDFLVLIADQMTGGRSEPQLLRKTNTTVELLLDSTDWRERRATAPTEPFRDFVCREFIESMGRMGFKAGTPMRINAQGLGVKLYRLCFFSKNELGIKFWEAARKNAPTQNLLFA